MLPRNAMTSSFEQAVEYAGDLHQAAMEVISELDDQDGVTVGTKEYYVLVRLKAKEHNVQARDLYARVKECL